MLFWSEPFSSALRMSNIKQYKYDWIWESNRSPNFAQAPYMPLKNYENIIVFSNWWCAHPAKNRMIYNPQWTTEINKVCNQKKAWIFKHKWSLCSGTVFILSKSIRNPFTTCSKGKRTQPRCSRISHWQSHSTACGVWPKWLFGCISRHGYHYLSSIYLQES